MIPAASFRPTKFIATGASRPGSCRSAAEKMKPEPFEIRVEDAVLSDLRRRIGATRWPPAIAGTDWSYGFDAGYLRKLAAAWQADYDWRDAERRMNQFAHYRVTIDDVPIHFLRQPGKG